MKYLANPLSIFFLLHGITYGHVAKLQERNQIVGVDAIGPLPQTKGEKEYIVTMIDHFPNL